MFLKGLFDIFGYWIVCLKLAIVAAVPGQNALLKVAAAVSVSADLRGCVENRGGQVDGTKKSLMKVSSAHIRSRNEVNCRHQVHAKVL